MSFLVVSCRLNAMACCGQDGLFFNPDLGGIDDLSFCGGLDQALSHCPPRLERVPYDNWCQDRFFFLQPDDCSGSTGSVEVTEALVYDNRMRGEIDFTGFRVTVSLDRNAYQTYLDYVDMMRVPALGDQDAWDGRILFRIPSQPFEFPMPRGSSSPWEVKKQIVGRLELIKLFAFDAIEIQALRDEQGRRVRLDEAAREGLSGLHPALTLCVLPELNRVALSHDRL